MGSSCGNSEEKNGSTSSSINRKERVRWTEELHYRFEEAINQLGGADRATPKGILKTVDIPWLTIYHVKSHLQKYRIVKFAPESSDSKWKQAQKEKHFRDAAQFQHNFLNDALRLHMEADRELSHQIKATLKLKIGAQGRYMDRITHDLKPVSPITSLPSLRDESESNIPKEQPSEPYLRSGSLKRFRVQNDLVSAPQMFHNCAPQPCDGKRQSCAIFNEQGMGQYII